MYDSFYTACLYFHKIPVWLTPALAGMSGCPQGSTPLGTSARKQNTSEGPRELQQRLPKMISSPKPAQVPLADKSHKESP